MSENIIDFLRRRSRDPETINERVEKYQHQRLADLSHLRTVLQESTRMQWPDRAVIVRNLGRLIERRYPGEQKVWASKLISKAFGNQAESILKKRSRYIRFEGEGASEGDQLFATRGQVLWLSDAWTTLIHGDTATDEQKAQVLSAVCEGTSFFEPVRPRLMRGKDCLQEFRLRLAGMIDRIARETDIVGYFDEMRHHDVETLPQSRTDLSKAELFALNEECIPVQRFEHSAGEAFWSSKDYSRLRLEGYNFRTEEPPALLPRARLARLYWPRTVLCLDVSASAAEVRAAELDVQERQLRERTLREAGLNSTQVNWAEFLDPTTGRALPGASWRVFWQARSIDLHLTAQDEPEALALGISALEPHWTHATKDLVRPQDDTVIDAQIENCTRSDEEEDLFAWFPDGDRMLVCRGFTEERPEPGTEEGTSGPSYKTIRHEPDECEMYEELMYMHFGPLDAGPAWELMTLPMQDWQSVFMANRPWSTRPEVQPALRPLFAAPAGWTPAPDDTLASAILRSLAYGEGEERLDEKLMAAVNKRVRCLDEMRGQLERNYEDALANNGYNLGKRS
ncbi:hypothetical protein [Aquicoccus sp. SU-CL01552]|uniref:hypothetical protein n=1 Tax=Aquicoccus sp. SU-CL01552 TaxID=3127656 RepID=UPI00310A394E